MFQTRKQISKSSQLAILLLIIFASVASSYMEKASARTTKGTSYYTLVMSENDAVCKPLLNFYNAHIASKGDNYDDSGFIEDRFGSTLHQPNPVFLLASPWWHQMFQNLNIYNDRRLRTVIINDFGINEQNVTLQSELLVIKPKTPIDPSSAPPHPIANGAEVSFIEMPNLFAPLDGPHIVDDKDTSIEQWIDFSQGGALSQDYGHRPPYYLLRKYPGFDKRFKALEREKELLKEDRDPGRVVDMPAIGQSTVQRIVLYNGMVFVSAREWLMEPKSRILVYKLNPAGTIDDTCYFEFLPRNFTGTK